MIALGCDNGGVHWNSTILSHAFYLAIEGGQNRTTGRTVQGVGGANRHDVERAFFRAMTHLMPARTTFPLTAAVIRQSAVDLFGTDAEESQSQRLCRAVRQVDQRGVFHTRGPARRGASASSRLRVHRTLPSRAKPPGTRQPAPATTTTSAKAGRRRSAAGTPRRITQFLQSRGRMRGRPIKRTLRGKPTYKSDGEVEGDVVRGVGRPNST